MEENHGYARGYNLAIKKLPYPYVVLLNSDVEASPDWLTPLFDFCESHPDVGACQPKLLAYRDKKAFEYAGAAGGFLDKYGYPYCRGRIFFSIENDEGQYDSPAEIFWATGACLFIRREVYLKAGGLDESFFAHMEEIDLCWRVADCSTRSPSPDISPEENGSTLALYGSPTITSVKSANAITNSPIPTY